MSGEVVFIVCDASVEAARLRDLLVANQFQARVRPNSGAVINEMVEDPPNLLLIDEVSPSMGPTSFDFIRDLREEPALESLPVLLLSVKKDPAQFPDAGRTAADVDLTKPVSNEDVMSQIRALIS
jgi:DNA-binding response OmpR family regulator